MQRILVRYLTGSRTNMTDEFPAGDYELIAGRDPSAQIHFDPDRDDLVSRQHAKIIREQGEGSGYLVVDLQSRNGTFLNRQRVYGAHRLNHNDVIQLGAGGPEFRFEMDPPPAMAPSQLEPPLGFTAGTGVKPTRESWLPDPQGKPQPVGRATVERMLGDVFTRVSKNSSRSILLGGIAVVAILLAGGGAYYYMRVSQKELKSSLSEAQQRNDSNILRVNEELKKAPEAVEEARKEVKRIEAELQVSNKRNESNQQALLAALEAARRQTAALERSLKQEQQKAKAAAVNPPAESSDPAQYDALRREAEERLDQGQASAAENIGLRMTGLDPNRWEGYALTGRAASMVGDYQLAKDMYKHAVDRVPAEMRPGLEQQLKAVQEITR